MRIRIAVTLGGFLLAGGLITGGAAFADQSQPTSAKPAPTAAPAPGDPTVTSARPAPGEPQVTRKPAQAPAPAPGKPRVPKAVPAGPVGDLHLPAITAA